MLLGRLMTSYQHGSGISLLLQHTNKLTNKKPLPAHEGSALPMKPYRAVGAYVLHSVTSRAFLWAIMH